MNKNEILNLFLSDTYKHTPPSGLLLFGSSCFANNLSNSSDIDLLVIQENFDHAVHKVDITNGIVFDYFVMSPEYAFYLLSRRNQMWLYNFSVGEISISHPALDVLKSISNEILKNEKPIYNSNEKEKNLFFLKTKYEKILRERSNEVYFNFALSDFFYLLNQHLHLSQGMWPGVGSNKEKIERLTKNFGSTSILVSKALTSNCVSEKISYLNEIMSKYYLDINKNKSFTIQDQYIKDKIDKFIRK